MNYPIVFSPSYILFCSEHHKLTYIKNNFQSWVESRIIGWPVTFLSKNKFYIWQHQDKILAVSELNMEYL